MYHIILYYITLVGIIGDDAAGPLPELQRRGHARRAAGHAERRAYMTILWHVMLYYITLYIILYIMHYILYNTMYVIYNTSVVYQSYYTTLYYIILYYIIVYYIGVLCKQGLWQDAETMLWQATY